MGITAPASAGGGPASVPLRADARRSRDAILEAARALFLDRGVLVPFDEVARRAAVGNATLYRHFPTRDALVLAAIQRDIVAVEQHATRLSQTSEPGAALREWLIQLVWHLRSWHGLPETVIDALDTASPLATACEPLQFRTAALLDRAREAGDADGDTTAAELFQLVTVLSWGADRYGDDERTARRRTELALSGYLRA